MGVEAREWIWPALRTHEGEPTKKSPRPTPADWSPYPSAIVDLYHAREHVDDLALPGEVPSVDLHHVDPGDPSGRAGCC